MKKLFIVFLFIIFIANINAQKKVVLLETFTSTTCPPCVPANQYFDNWYSSYTNKSAVAVIKYHVGWPAPGNDPFYLANPDEVSTRRVFYNISAVPNGLVDGFNYGSNYPNWTAVIENKIKDTPPINISFAKGTTADEIKVIVESLNNYSANNLVLHVVLVESKLYYTGTNGDPVHNFVMRKMYPNSSGTTFNLIGGEKKSFSNKISISSNWVKNNCAVVAFVQTSTIKDVVQAVMQDYNLITSVENEINIPNNFSLEQNFPNPFNPETIIKYSIPDFHNNKLVSLKVYDLLGNEVETLVSEYQKAGNYEVKFNAKNFTSGCYLYKLQVGNSIQAKKMMLIK
ncbi:MAG: Omp28-related outer membrane protein [Melioribacteraceae bacterium]|nr:Omp28-related outer membrane protein [Melioribacteraceae bacterium]